MYSLNRRISAQCGLVHGLVTFAVFGSTCTSTDYLTHHIYTKCLVLMLVLFHPQSASSVARGTPPVVRSSDGKKRLTRSGGSSSPRGSMRSGTATPVATWTGTPITGDGWPAGGRRAAGAGDLTMVDPRPEAAACVLSPESKRSVWLDVALRLVLPLIAPPDESAGVVRCTYTRVSRKWLRVIPLVDVHHPMPAAIPTMGATRPEMTASHDMSSRVPCGATHR